MTEKMELSFDVQKISIFVLMITVNPLSEVAGLIIGNTTATACAGSRANITFAVDLQTGIIPSGSEIWYYEATLIATKPAGVFSPQGNYASRLHNYSTYGLALDNITAADGGRYLFVFSYYSPTPQGFQTATATLTVKVAPTDSCIPSYRQSGDLAICELDPAANCGSPRLEPMWTNEYANTFTVTKAWTYTCCANGSILMDCYLGSHSFCKTFQVSGNAAYGEDSKAQNNGENNGQQNNLSESKKGDSEPTQPVVIYNRIRHKDESETEHVPSKPFDPKERQPLYPLNKELKYKPNHRPQPIPSEKNDVKDQTLRELSAIFDGTRGLASETPRPSKLPPNQHQVQSTVQEEDTTEEPKMNKKNRKKKDKTDEGRSAD